MIADAIYRLIGRLVVWAGLTYVRRRYGKTLRIAGTVGAVGLVAGAVYIAARDDDHPG